MENVLKKANILETEMMKEVLDQYNIEYTESDFSLSEKVDALFCKIVATIEDRIKMGWGLDYLGSGIDRIAIALTNNVVLKVSKEIYLGAITDFIYDNFDEYADNSSYHNWYESEDAEPHYPEYDYSTLTSEHYMPHNQQGIEEIYTYEEIEEYKDCNDNYKYLYDHVAKIGAYNTNCNFILQEYCTECDYSEEVREQYEVLDQYVDDLHYGNVGIGLDGLLKVMDLGFGIISYRLQDEN